MPAYSLFPFDLQTTSAETTYLNCLTDYFVDRKIIQVAGSSWNPWGKYEMMTLWERVDSRVPPMLQSFTPSTTESEVLALNNIYPTWAVGWRIPTGDISRVPMLWRKSGNTQLSTLGGVAGEARGVNDSGLIAGYAEDANNKHKACIWEFGSPVKDLGTLGGPESEAFAINNLG